MSRSALVIGGTGPTGPGVVRGLLDRGFDVTILHGGQHEVELPAEVRHIHTDPHWPDTLGAGLGRAEFDLVVAQYGRLAVTTQVLAGRTDRVVAVGGAHGSLAHAADPRWGALGRPALPPEEAEHLEQDPAHGTLAVRMAAAEQALFDAHAAGAFAATLLAYPVVYGPRQVAPHEWCIVRRILDGRRRIVVADGAIRMETRLYTEHAVHAVLLAVDHRAAASGRKFVVADDNLFTMRQRIEFIAARLGVDVELVDMPYPLATPCHPYWRHGPDHRLRGNARSRAELGYADTTPAADALGATVDWLVEHPPVPGGPEEKRLGDRFDYAHEDDLMERWAAVRRDWSDDADPFRPAHAYRHPRRPDETWHAGGTATT
ncbi:MULTISPECIES: NAD(P)-dependent oxidoreductase [unclassified Parafrankia]|uniref:NAD-dependent epimerase/dehydratase family protein n=1 Tax=unclassified Parafrankia TaxID=2994368 RepID=UPI000DA5C142|nr:MULTISPECIES: NAD-dependent dehydratase [unclassified Parafrankia]TCJ31416.1 NAD-dependent dehydratase [Parafrankia sp. BMG5.11]SQD95587.1 NAD-dependent epimerase/dehydratase [Parafrankia sp. Ea1.12]